VHVYQDNRQTAIGEGAATGGSNVARERAAIATSSGAATSGSPDAASDGEATRSWPFRVIAAIAVVAVVAGIVLLALGLVEPIVTTVIIGAVGALIAAYRLWRRE
jgi:small-conductance mechanosensitive channel